MHKLRNKIFFERSLRTNEVFKSNKSPTGRKLQDSINILTWACSVIRRNPNIREPELLTHRDVIRFATSRELHRGISWLESHFRSWIVYTFRIVAQLFRLGLLKKTLEWRIKGRNLPTVLVVGRIESVSSYKRRVTLE